MSNNEIWLFEWNPIIPLKVSKICEKQGNATPWNPKCIEQARVHVNPANVEQVSVMLVEGGHVDEICKGSNNGHTINFGSLDYLPTYSFRKPNENNEFLLQCAFVDFTQLLHNILINWKVTLGLLRPVVVVELKEGSNIWKSRPFITVMGPRE